MDSEKKNLDKRHDYEWAAVLKLKGFPEVHKESNVELLIQLISKAILAIMEIFMAFTKPIKRLRIISKVIFDCCIFGVEETRSVLTTLTRKLLDLRFLFPGKF